MQPTQVKICGFAPNPPHAGLTPEQVRELVCAQPRAEHVLKSDQRSRVWKVQTQGRWWVVKQYHLPWLKRVLYHCLRATPAWREWRGAQRLAALGERVNVPIALLDGALHGLVLPWADGPTLDALVADPALAARVLGVKGSIPRRTLAQRVGDHVGAMAAGGWINRDCKLTNLIADAACVNEHQAPLVIDADGLRRRQSDDDVLRTLAILRRGAQRVGQVSRAEMVRCVRATLQADPSLGPDGDLRARLRWATARLQSMHDARPLSYDPVTKRSLRANAGSL